MVASNVGASPAVLMRISGTDGCAWLYRRLEPSIRDVCRPADLATATGAAESHSYCPPLCTYASTSPVMTDADLAPAEPSGTSTAPSSSASRCTNSGGRDLLTTSRNGAPGAGPGGAGGGSAVD